MERQLERRVLVHERGPGAGERDSPGVVVLARRGHVGEVVVRVGEAPGQHQARRLDHRPERVLLDQGFDHAGGVERSRLVRRRGPRVADGLPRLGRARELECRRVDRRGHTPS